MSQLTISMKPAAFMPIFATSTVEGPANHEALIQQMKAAGMTAGAWMVEDLVQRLDQLEALAGGLEINTLAEVKDSASKLDDDLGSFAAKMEGLAERLGMALTPDELGAEAEKANLLKDEAEEMAERAAKIYVALCD